MKITQLIQHTAHPPARFLRHDVFLHNKEDYKKQIKSASTEKALTLLFLSAYFYTYFCLNEQLERGNLNTRVQLQRLQLYIANAAGLYSYLRLKSTSF